MVLPSATACSTESLEASRDTERSLGASAFEPVHLFAYTLPAMASQTGSASALEGLLQAWTQWAWPLPLLLLLLLAGCSGMGSYAGNPDEPRRVRCLSEVNPSAEARPLFFLFCIQSP